MIGLITKQKNGGLGTKESSLRQQRLRRFVKSEKENGVSVGPIARQKVATRRNIKAEQKAEKKQIKLINESTGPTA